MDEEWSGRASSRHHPHTQTRAASGQAAAEPEILAEKGVQTSDSLEKVLERMAIGDDVVLTVKRDLDGKMRATARTWADAKVLGRDEVIEIRNVDGQVRVARKERRHDEWDPPIAPYDPYGPGEQVSADASDEFTDD